MSTLETDIVKSALIPDSLYGLLNRISAIFVLLVIGIYVFQLFINSVQGFTVVGLTQIAVILGIWIAFLDVGFLSESEDHISITFLSKRLRPPLDHYHSLIVLFLNSIASIFIFISSLLLLIELGDGLLGPLKLPAGVYYFPITLTGFLLSINYSSKFIRVLLNKRQ